VHGSWVEERNGTGVAWRDMTLPRGHWTHDGYTTCHQSPYRTTERTTLLLLPAPSPSCRYFHIYIHLVRHARSACRPPDEQLMHRHTATALTGTCKQLQPRFFLGLRSSTRLVVDL